MKQESSGGHHS